MKPNPIDQLIDRVRAAAASDRNKAKGRTPPYFRVGVDDPTVTAYLFGYDFDRYFSDPAYYVEQTLRQKLWRFEHIDDDVPITAEISSWLGYYPEYTLLGMSVHIDKQGVAILQEDHPLTRDANMALLAPVNFQTSGWMPRILRWHEAIQRLVAGRLTVGFNMLWWRGCLDLAMQLRGYDNFILDSVERPAFAHALLQFLADQRCEWHRQYYRHFNLPVQPTFIGDDWLNVPFISPDFFEEFVLPRYLAIERFHGAISAIHSCGNQTPLQPLMLRIRSLNQFEVSPWTDLQQTLINLPPGKAIGIDLHPTEIFLATPAALKKKLEGIVAACRGRSYSIGAGLSLTAIDRADYLRRLRRFVKVARAVLGKADAVSQAP